MLTFANLETIFTNAGKPCWTLYKGASKGNQIGSYYPESGDGDPNMLDSWARLKDLVETYGDGIFTVECKSSRTTSKGNDQHTFMLGEVQGKSEKVGSVAAPAHPASSFFQGLDAKFFMNQTFDAQNRIQELQLQLLRKEMELERVKMTAKAKVPEVSGTDRFLNILEKNPALLEKGIGLLSGQPVAIGTLKAQQPIPAAAPVGNFDEDDDQGEDYDYTPGRIDLNALFLSAQQIQKALPELHINTILDQLADFCEAQPDQARAALNMMSV
jgi:hypothetical protein